MLFIRNQRYEIILKKALQAMPEIKNFIWEMKLSVKCIIKVQPKYKVQNYDR